MADGAEPARIGRLRWACRRGMKELDVLLESFLTREQAALAAGQWPEFEAFLATEDDVLWDWLQGRDTPEDSEYRKLLARISTRGQSEFAR